MKSFTYFIFSFIILISFSYALEDSKTAKILEHLKVTKGIKKAEKKRKQEIILNHIKKQKNLDDLRSQDHIVEDFALSKYWRRLLTDFGMKYDNHSFCTTSTSDKIIGANPYMKVRLASVSKVITSLWAIESLGPDYRYPTEFYFSESGGKNKLHIVGSLDPVFSKRKLFILLNQFINHGITEIDEITFDSETRVFPAAEDRIYEILSIGEKETVRGIRDYFNVEKWRDLKYNFIEEKWEDLRDSYRDFIENTPKEILHELNIKRKLSDLRFKVGSVKFKNSNDLLDGDEIRRYIHLSPTLTAYLKFVNIFSKNHIADQVFDKLGGEEEFDKYMDPILGNLFSEMEELREGYSESERSMKMYSGSGLSIRRNDKRKDNYANCTIIIRLIERLDKVMQEAGKTIQEVVAVVAKDWGTFARRLRSRRLVNSIVAKTGTLYHTSTIAGMVNGKDKRRYFGIFHQLTGAKVNAKIVQNKMITKLWEYYEGKQFEYEQQDFFPVIDPLVEILDE